MVLVAGDASSKRAHARASPDQQGVSRIETLSREHAIHMANLEQVLKIPLFYRDQVPG
jgi:hypothetical protein